MNTLRVTTRPVEFSPHVEFRVSVFSSNSQSLSNVTGARLIKIPIIANAQKLRNVNVDTRLLAEIVIPAHNPSVAMNFFSGAKSFERPSREEKNIIELLGKLAKQREEKAPQPRPMGEKGRAELLRKIREQKVNNPSVEKNIIKLLGKLAKQREEKAPQPRPMGEKGRAELLRKIRKQQAHNPSVEKNIIELLDELAKQREEEAPQPRPMGEKGRAKLLREIRKQQKKAKIKN